jgi:hypothetical protein
METKPNLTEGKALGGAGMQNPSWLRVAAGVIFVFNAGANAQKNHDDALIIRLYDEVAAPPAILRAATAQAARIFAAAGVQLVWHTASNSAPEAHRLDFSPLQEGLRDGRDYLSVRLVSGLPDTAYPDAVGFALPHARFGAHVTILYDRFDSKFARFGDDKAAILLGVMIAHEVGHVLLGSADHSAAGLMKGRWNDTEIMLAVTGRLYFSGEQRQRLREAARRRHEAGPDPLPPAIARSGPGSSPAPGVSSVPPRPARR